MATKHPSQDSDAEIDKLLEKLSSDVVDSTIYTHQTADLEGGQQYLLKGKAEAKQTLLALKARWEAEGWKHNGIDLNDTNYMLQFIDDPIEKFNVFIQKWCPDYPHLIDSDDNDGEKIRQMITALQNQLPTKENP